MKINDIPSGWWLLEHEWIMFPCIGNVIIPIAFHIFQRGLFNHQPDLLYPIKMLRRIPLAALRMTRKKYLDDFHDHSDQKTNPTY